MKLPNATGPSPTLTVPITVLLEVSITQTLLSTSFGHIHRGVPSGFSATPLRIASHRHRGHHCVAGGIDDRDGPIGIGSSHRPACHPVSLATPYGISVPIGTVATTVLLDGIDYRDVTRDRLILEFCHIDARAVRLHCDANWILIVSYGDRGHYRVVGGIDYRHTAAVVVVRHVDARAVRFHCHAIGARILPALWPPLCCWRYRLPRELLSALLLFVT